MVIVKKQIKFDLPIDGEKVKTVDELTEHLTVELVGHLKSGLLAKWLLAREAELAQIIQAIEINDKSDRELLIEILDGLGFETDEQIIDAMFAVHEQQLQAKPQEKSSAKAEEETVNQTTEEAISMPQGNTDIIAGDDVSGRKFVNCDFSGKNLLAVNFSDCVFENTNFNGANLLGALFTNSKFEQTTMVEADATNANFEGAEIINCDFSHITAKNAKFIQAKITKSNFIQANLNDVNMFGVQILNSDFTHSELKSAVLEEANLRAVKFNNANFDGTYAGAKESDGINPTTDTECKFVSVGCDYSHVKFSSDGYKSNSNFRFIYRLLKENNQFTDDHRLSGGFFSFFV